MSNLARLAAVAAVLLLSSPTWGVDDPDELLPGKLVLLKPTITFKVIAKPAGSFALPSAGNTPLDGGATLRVFDTGMAAGDGTYPLPIGGWKGLGNPAGSKGYKYKGAGTPGDPCRVVLIKPTIVKAVCKGPGVNQFPPATGTLSVILTTTGTGSKRYCAAFGGQVVQNEAGLLKLKDAPAIPCVTTTDPSVCGNGMIEGIEHCDDSNTLPGDGCDAICQIEETRSAPVSGGGSVSSDDGEGDGATPTDPLETSVTSPNAGSVTIFESSPGTPPAGFEFRGQAVLITAPDASSSTTPLDLTFTIDATQMRPGETEATVQVFRGDVLVPPCLGGTNEAVPEPCIRSRTSIGGGDVQLRVFATHTSPWSFGYPLCGNGMLDGGEACDPPAGGCGGGDSCKLDCTCGPVCNCCAGSPSTVTITHAVPGGTCGTVVNSMGVSAISLACNTVYFGGGGNSVPAFPIPDSQFVLDVQSCDPVEEKLILGPTTLGETGNLGTCTSAGCRFGAPIVVPNPGSTPTSSCIVARISQDMSGIASCGGVVTQIGLPVEAVIYLTGDTVTDPANTIAGIQSCPLCSAGTCVGGPNNGMACSAENSAFNAGYPTSNDCPPDPMFSIGTIPVGPELTTGTVSWTGTLATHDTGSSVSVQNRVFVGYCRDTDATGAFQSPAHQCWENGMAVGTACSGLFESCEQRNNGAFGPGGGANNTIDQVGAAAGCLADGLPHAVRIVGPMRIPPSFDATVDAAADLPGPGTFGITGDMQVQ